MRLNPNAKISATWYIIAVSAALSLAVIIILLMGTGRTSLREVAAILLISTASVALGRVLCVLLALGQHHGITTAFEIVAGSSAVALLTLGWVAIFDLGAAVAFVLTFLLVAGLVLTFSLGPMPLPRRSLAFDLALVVVLAVVVAMWTRSTADAPEVARATGFYPAWPDYFAHAAEIRYLRDNGELKGLSPTLAGAPQVLYHRGSYALSSVFAALGGRKTLEVASCHWAPFGLLLMAIGAYGYGSVIAGRRGGAVGALALLLVPDALSHGFGNRLFSFHWLIAVGPAAAYAIALGFSACALLLLGQKRSRPTLSVAGGALAVGTIFLKVQVTLPLLVALASVALIVWKPRQSWHRIGVVGVVLVLAVAAAFQFEAMQRMPRFLSGHFDTTGYLDYIHRTPSVYREWYIQMVQGSGIIQQNLIGVALVLLAALGFFLPLAAATFFLRMKRGAASLADFLSVALIGGYLIAMYGMPAPFNGDPGEFKHRPFVLIYAFLVVGSVSAMTAILTPSHANRLGQRLALLFAGGCLVLGLLHVSLASPSAQYYDDYHGRAVSHDLFGAADFISGHAGNEDVILSSDLDPEGVLVALTERSAYLSRVPVFRKASEKTSALVARRTKLVENLWSIRTPEELRAFGRAEGIQWFVLYAGDNPDWSGAFRAAAAHASAAALVFDLREAMPDEGMLRLDGVAPLVESR